MSRFDVIARKILGIPEPELRRPAVAQKRFAARAQPIPTDFGMLYLRYSKLTRIERAGSIYIGRPGGWASSKQTYVTFESRIDLPLAQMYVLMRSRLPGLRHLTSSIDVMCTLRNGADDGFHQMIYVEFYLRFLKEFGLLDRQHESEPPFP